MSKKLITVFGATGNQGGSVITALLSSSHLKHTYSIRAITRDPTKPSAQKLASQGCELAKADLSDYDSVRTAISGSYGVFAVTNYWELVSKEGEKKQGFNIVNACKAEGVKHLVWSALPNVSKMTHGKLTRIEHFDSKAEVGEYAEKNKGEMFVSYFMPAYFMSNLKGAVRQDDDEGCPVISMPWHPTNTHLPMIDIRKDSGKFVVGILEKGKAADGKSVHAVGQWITPKEVTDTLSKITGVEIKFVEIHEEVYMKRRMDKIAAELMENMVLIRDYSYYGNGAEKIQGQSDEFFLEGAKKTTWEEFASENGPWL